MAYEETSTLGAGSLRQKVFKKAGVLRAAFEYQDLVGIDLLISYYRDPQLYKWVKLEAEDAQTGYLDDVVAARPDGSFDVVQVKFTPEPDTHALGWEWLLSLHNSQQDYLFGGI